MKNWIRRNLVTVILLGMMAVGAGLIAYPSIANWWNSFHQSRAVASYASAVAGMNHEEYDDMLLEAQNYNAELSETGAQWEMTDEQLTRYEEVLNVRGSGIMGYIDIPKIRVRLPVYHGMDDTVLEVAVGHITGTSLPVGGESSHCVISGHRGLPSARLFTDIDKLVEGDTWTLNILDQTLTYEVDQIRVVVPTDLSNLQIEEGKDYCTLVTCTPYGINTHRLLVRGHRVPNAQGNARITADAIQIEPAYAAPFIAAPILVILIFLLLISTRKKR